MTWVSHDVSEFLVQRKDESLLRRIQSIEILTPARFARILDSSNAKVVHLGFNGAIFLSTWPRSRGFKLAHVVQAAFEELKFSEYQLRVHPIDLQVIRERWSVAASYPWFSEIDIDQESEGLFELGITPPISEVWGTIAWSRYRPEDLLLPDLISSDGLAIQREYLKGTPLNVFLERDRLGLIRQTAMKEAIWSDVAKIFHKAETLLGELGVTVDLLNPANILVVEESETLVLRVVDQELIVPSNWSKGYYERIGKPVGAPWFRDLRYYVEWPLFPGHIIASRVWGLSYKQSLLFLQIYYQSTRNAAMEQLAASPMLPNRVNPRAQTFENIQRARSEITDSRY